MRKLFAILALFIGLSAYAGEPARKFSVSQKMLTTYRQANPNFNFYPDLDDLFEEQARQLVEYFYVNWRIGEIQNYDMGKTIFELRRTMEEDEIEAALIKAINEFYKWGEFRDPKLAWSNYPAFSAPLGSTSMVDHLNIGKEKVPKFLEILKKYTK